MAPNQSTLRGDQAKLSAAEKRQFANRWRADSLYPPPIVFHIATHERSNNKGKDDSEEEKDHSDQVKFNIRLGNDEEKDGDSDKDEQKCARYVKVFKTGTPEEWCNHQETVDRLNEQMGNTTAKSKRAVYQATFDKPALGWFDSAWASRKQARASEKKRTGGDNNLTQEDYELILAQALNDVGKKLMPGDANQAVRLQKKYLHQNLHMDRMEPQEFRERLEKINGYIKYLPLPKI